MIKIRAKMDSAHQELSFEYQHGYTAVILRVPNVLAYFNRLSFFINNHEDESDFRNTKTVSTR